MSIYPFLTLLPKIGIQDKKKKDEWSFFWPYFFLTTTISYTHIIIRVLINSTKFFYNKTIVVIIFEIVN